MSHLTAYQARVNVERLERQAAGVQKTAKEILEELKSLEQSLYWALDPDERDGGIQWSESFIEHAHALVDLGHDYRAALKANPPLKEADEDPSLDGLQTLPAGEERNRETGAG